MTNAELIAKARRDANLFLTGPPMWQEPQGPVNLPGEEELLRCPSHVMALADRLEQAEARLAEIENELTAEFAMRYVENSNRIFDEPMAVALAYAIRAILDREAGKT